ncbi:metallophosphoesterase family protein [Natronomonas salina]|uniref:DNA double-strand break repair protein Mre11 n=1 Tax=Natronomonas salina TaxID=1710540 RepID=UPI0015B6B0D3|nr:DNA double-strand break repair protein Mre11 [Natronomonas salina]QLD88589.1 metallophosphoesterase family protein [Natronomonas salina]
MTRVLHTGDTHLGYRQYHLPERRSDFLDAFRRVAEDAIELDVDAVVHAGDLFHDRRPGLPDLLGTLDVLETLDDAGVPFLAVVGNHETKRDAQWLDLFEAMGLATRLGDEPLVVGDTAFYGLDFVPRAQREDLEYDFEPHDADHAALVSHGLFQPLVPDYGNVEWDAAAVLSESTVDFDAMLLGDEHAPTTQEVEDTWVTYCGSTERASAGEREDRGYNLVEFDGDARITRRGLETREFVFVDLELAEGEGFDRVRERLREHDLEGAVVHVTLDGDGEDVSAARVEAFASDEGALVARVNDHREISEEADLEVAFADPDEAVRERVRELGLSDAARDLDETIRASKVADSNVADEVERRVADLLDEPEAFESGPAEEPETAADRMGAETDDESDSDAAEAVADAGSQSADTETGTATEGTKIGANGGDTDTEAAPDAGESDAGEDIESGADPDAGDEEDGSTEDQPSDGTDSSDSSDSADASEPARPAQAGDGDGQASMEDYL